MTRVVFRPEAEIDLVAIALSVAERSESRALALVKRLRARCAALERHPQTGRPRGELGPGLRSLVERPYIIFYRVEGGVVEVVAVVHGARDLPRAMAGRV